MDARDKRERGDGEVLDLIGTRSKARSRQVCGDQMVPNLSGDISDISTGPSGTMPLKKFFRVGTGADDCELTIGVCSRLADMRANELI